MLSKLKTSLFILPLVLTSCEDFTQKNIEFAAPKAPEENVVDRLLVEATSINEGEFSIEKLIANMGTFVTQPVVEDLKNQMDVLDASLKSHCGAINVLPTLDESQLTELRKPLQENWKKAMLTYHKLATLNYGPAAEETSTAMNSLYSFDGEEKCRVDLQLFRYSRQGDAALPRFDVIDNYNVRGLDSLEPLFFASPSKTRCSRANSRITEWFEKPLIEKEKIVCVYSLHLMKDMVAKANELSKAWSPQTGHFTAQMLRGKKGSPIEVANQVSQALYYLDTNTKDRKLSYPAGLEVRIDGTVQSCSPEICPEKREHLYADIGYEALLVSLEGFKILFQGIGHTTGQDGFGFDDLLIIREKASLSERLVQGIEAAIKNVEAQKTKTSFKELFENIDREKCEATTSEKRTVEACALVQDIRKVTNLLKNEYLNALGELSAPRQAQGDND